MLIVLVVLTVALVGLLGSAPVLTRQAAENLQVSAMALWDGIE